MASQEERDRIMAEYLAQVQGDDDDDDDDDEAEFHPGMHDDDESDGDDNFRQDDDDEDYVVMKGTLSRHDGQLIYKGHLLKENFELKSIQRPLHWNLHHPTRTCDTEEVPTMRTIAMEGTMGPHHCSKVDMTITMQTEEEDATKPAAAATKSTGDDDEKMPSKQAAAKSTGEDEDDGKMPSKPAAAAKSDEQEDDGKMPSKPAAADESGKQSADDKVTIYTVFGKGTDASGPFEFFGKLDVKEESHHALPLECQKRTLAKPPPVAAAAAAAPNDDDDDVDDEADEGVDYDELIALHQDAGLPLPELRKRYRGQPADEGEESNKKPKAEEPEDDDDDEYGF